MNASNATWTMKCGHYLRSLVDEKIQHGMRPEDARRSATLELGGVDALKERIREVKAGAFLDMLLLDIRYGMRMLRKYPSFALAAIVTLGLGIGANTAIFTLVDALALRSLPVREPRELVYLEMAWGSAAIVGIVTNSSPSFVLDVRPDTRVLGFTAIVSLATVFSFGLAPAFRATGTQSAPLIAGVRSSLSERSGLGWNRMLVTGQLALSLVLVFAAGLFVRTVEKALAENGGFNRQNVLTFSTDPSLLRYDPMKTSALHQAILAAVKTIPGVDVASAALARPVNPQAYYVSGFGFVHGRVLPPNERVRLAWNAVSEDYFKTLEIPILAGRSFSVDDGWSSPRVTIVNETLARQLFPGQNPIGFTIGRNEKERTEIVGVARDTKYADLLSDVRAVAYFPIYQVVPSDVTFLVRYAGQTGPILNVARERIAALDPNLPIYRVNTLEAEASAALLRQRLLAVVSTAFGLLALALACVGLYGLMAFAVACRVKEIGVRMALGANQRQVLWATLRESLVMIVVGVVIGVPIALALMRLARTFLFGLTPADPMTLTAAIVVLTVVAVVAGYIPARRASRVEPMVALRVE